MGLGVPEPQVEHRELIPTSFYVIGIPLPTQQQAAVVPQEAFKQTFAGGMRIGGFDANAMREAKVGIRAAVVTGVGPLPEDHPREIHAPYDKGATIYYPEGADVEIGDQVLLHIERVLAYTEAE